MSGPNPYLRWPVILDEYVKNRDVWRCPSATYINEWSIISNTSDGANGDWWRSFQLHEGECPGVRGCSNSFPPGWGGTATDMTVQGCAGRAESNQGGFEMSIGSAPRWALDTKTSAMTDPVKYAVAYDAGTVANGADRCSWLAYPDLCRLDGVAACGCGGDWANCSWSAYCSAEAGDYRWATDPTFRKKNGHTRHLGGVNLGFADGHATWMDSETVLFGGEDCRGYASHPDDPLLLGFGVGLVPVVPK
jgi:prepilin-type processing-associated H-X9-DG protein